MGKKVVKSLCLVLVGLMAVASFSGCSGTSNKTNGKTTITFSMWSAVPDAPNNFIDTFQAKYPNIKVSVNTITEGDYSQKINTMVAAGTAPDVMLL